MRSGHLVVNAQGDFVVIASAREALVKLCTLPLLAGDNISRFGAFGH